MVCPVEVCEQHTAETIVDFVGAHADGAHAVAVSRRSYTIKEKRELVQAISALASNGVSYSASVSFIRGTPPVLLPLQKSGKSG